MYYGRLESAKPKKWGWLGSQEEPSDHLGFPLAPAVPFIYSHSLPTLVFLIQEQTACHGYRTFKMAKIWQQGAILCRSTMDIIQMYHYLYRNLLLLACMSASLITY